MRLLYARDVARQKFTFHDFMGEPWPIYAILSHTWGHDEVIHQDLLTEDAIGRARKKAGYAKLERFAALVTANSVPWIWMDTCCIDKTSSSELSEAINSMYNWYASAEVCYAFLADVTHITPQSGPGTEEQLTANAFAIPWDRWSEDHKIRFPRDYTLYSRWFYRGWTLQEMLAPLEVFFFDRDWKYMGAKTRMCSALAAVTGVPGPVLGRIRPLQSYSVAQRMSWASNRSTSRIEDEAYCMFGLFRINMPLLYGEGTRAFLRLQQEIMAHSDDQSIFAWGGPCPLCFQFPVEIGVDRSPSFSGVLAASPRNFWSMHGVFRIDPFTLKNTATFLSGRIKFPVPFAQVTYLDSHGEEQTYCVAVLACMIGSDLVGTVLKRSGDERYNYFVRDGTTLVRIPTFLIAAACARDMLPRTITLPIRTQENEPSPAFRRLSDTSMPGKGNWFDPIDLSELVPAEFAATHSYHSRNWEYLRCFRLGEWDERVKIIATWPSGSDPQGRIWTGADGIAAIAVRPCEKHVFVLRLCWQNQRSVCNFILCDNMNLDESDPNLEDKMSKAMESISRQPKPRTKMHRIKVGPGMWLETRVYSKAIHRNPRWIREATIDLSFRTGCHL